MRNQIRRVLSLVLCMLLLCATIPMTASAQAISGGVDTTEDDLTQPIDTVSNETEQIAADASPLPPAAEPIDEADEVGLSQDGNGVYLLTSAQDMQDMANLINGTASSRTAVFELQNDIDMNGAELKIATAYNKQFAGTFRSAAGHQYTLSNFKVTGTTSQSTAYTNAAALFCYASGATFQDFKLSNVTVTNSGIGSAVLVGFADKSGTSGAQTAGTTTGAASDCTFTNIEISDCTVTSGRSVSGTAYSLTNSSLAGTLIGCVWSSSAGNVYTIKGITVKDCTVQNTGAGGAWGIGGLIGESRLKKQSDTTNTGTLCIGGSNAADKIVLEHVTVTGYGFVGGVIGKAGWIHSTTYPVTPPTSGFSFTPANYYGGLNIQNVEVRGKTVGETVLPSTITAGNGSGNGGCCGGILAAEIVGIGKTSISNCTVSDTTITSNNNLSTITSYTSDCGGIAGHMSGTVSNCEVKDSTISSCTAGGIVGRPSRKSDSAVGESDCTLLKIIGCKVTGSTEITVDDFFTGTTYEAGGLLASARSANVQISGCGVGSGVHIHGRFLRAGGFIGYAYSTKTTHSVNIQDSTSLAKVEILDEVFNSSENVGSAVGGAVADAHMTNDNLNIISCAIGGELNNNGFYCGGVIGRYNSSDACSYLVAYCTITAKLQTTDEPIIIMSNRVGRILAFLNDATVITNNENYWMGSSGNIAQAFPGNFVSSYPQSFSDVPCFGAHVYGDGSERPLTDYSTLQESYLIQTAHCLEDVNMPGGMYLHGSNSPYTIHDIPSESINIIPIVNPSPYASGLDTRLEFDDSTDTAQCKYAGWVSTSNADLEVLSDTSANSVYVLAKRNALVGITANYRVKSALGNTVFYDPETSDPVLIPVMIPLELTNIPVDHCQHEYGEPVWNWAADYSSATATFACVFCNDEQTVDAAIDVNVVRAATCTENEIIRYAASVTINGVEYTNETGNITRSDTVLDHHYDSFMTAPTCTEDGVMTYTCACGESYTETIPALGHDYNAVVTEPTCTAGGYTTHTCARCGDTYTDSETDATGHTWDAAVTVAATCTEGGYTTYTCSRCGVSYTANESPALGHDFGEWVVTQAATYTEEGTETRTCSRCGATETQSIPRLTDIGGECSAQGGNVTWTLNPDTGVLTISGTGSMRYYSSASSVPWYDYRSWIQTAVIENGVIGIGSNAFNGCNELTSVAIADSVTAIGTYAFQNCTSLASMTIPNGTTTVSAYAFQNCTSLANVTIPTSVTRIDTYAFEGCTSLQSLTLPDGLTDISSSVFKGCTSLTSVTLPDTVIRIDICAFDSCTSLESVIIPGSVTRFGTNAFSNCTNLISVTIQNGVNCISGGAFFGCTNLERVTIPNSVTEIGIMAFMSCPSLQSIHIPQSVTAIGAGSSGAFDSNSLSFICSGTADCFAKTYADANGIEFRVCANHGDHVHVYNAAVTTEPTCTADGVATYSCACGASYTETIPALGHDYNAVVTEPTCTAGGYTTYTCSRCGYSYTADETPPIDSINVTFWFSNGNEIQAAFDLVVTDGTAENYGYTVAAADHVGAAIDTITAMDVLVAAHKAFYGNAFTAQTASDFLVVSSSCITKAFGLQTYNLGFTINDAIPHDDTYLEAYNGYTGYAIDTARVQDGDRVCLFVYKDSYWADILPLFDSTSIETEAHETFTVSADGYSVMYYGCSTQETIDANTKPLKGVTVERTQDFSAFTTVGTLDADGKLSVALPQDGTYYLVVRGMFNDESSGSIPVIASFCKVIVQGGSTEHTWDSGTVTTEPTCTEEGVMTYTCACGDTYTQAIPALGHDYNAVVTDPTCTAGGYTTHTCTRCGDTYMDSETDATGHTWDAAVTVAATCTEDGVMTYTCACGESYTETIPASGHDYNAVVTEPTCTAGGYTTHTCARCGDSYTDSETDATGHTWDAAVTVAATCTEDGVMTYTCACGESYTETIPALGHDYNAVVTEPTCTAGGYTTHTCARCGNAYVNYFTDALGHDFGAWVVTLEATVDTQGKETRVCSRCDAFETRTVPKLPADGDPSFALTGGSAHAGETIEVAVSLRNNPGIISTLLRLNYDPQVLTLVSVRNGDVFTEDAFQNGGELNAVPFGTLWLTPLSDNNTNNGTLVTYTFAVAADAPACTTAITVSYDVKSTFNTDLQPVEFAVQNAEWNILERIAGDANGDGVLDLKDVVIIKRALVGGWGVSLVDVNADVNDDSSTDLRDATLIARYIAGGWDVELI